MRAKGILIVAVLAMSGCSPKAEVPWLTPSSTTPVTSMVAAASVPSLDPSATALWATLAAGPHELATANAQRKAFCPRGYELEEPELVAEMSTDKWTIFTCSPVYTDYSKLWTPGAVDYSRRFTEVIARDSSTVWEIQHGQFDWSQRPQALLSTYRWTTDGEYLYVKPFLYPGGSGFFAPDFFLDGAGLYRLDLNTGKFQEVLPAAGYYAYSLSPDDQLLAFAYPEERSVIHVRTVPAGDEFVVDIGAAYDIVGAFAWAPDSMSLFFAGGLKGWDKAEAGTSIFRLNIQTRALQPFRVDDARLFVPYPSWSGDLPEYWASDNLLYVRSLDEHSPLF